MYYRGVVSEVFQQQPELEAPESQWAAYDPWEAVEVAWDGKSGGHSGPCSSAVCTSSCGRPGVLLLCTARVIVGLKAALRHAAGQLECVNPWELESDPDFERTEGERQREQEAEARALRAQAIALRRQARAPLASLHRQLPWHLWHHLLLSGCPCRLGAVM